MKAVVAAFNQEKALVGAFSVITNLRMELFEALDETVNILKERKKREEELGEERVHYEQLCRGEEFVSVAEKSKMMCRYNFGKHDFLRIGPLKEEEVFLSPRIVLFHNFLTNSEVDTIKSMAAPRFKRATVQNYLTGELETANYRWVVHSKNIFAV